MSRVALILSKLSEKSDNMSDQADEHLEEYATKSCVKRIATLLKGDVVDAEELMEEFYRLHKYQHDMMDREKE